MSGRRGIRSTASCVLLGAVAATTLTAPVAEAGSTAASPVPAASTVPRPSCAARPPPPALYVVADDAAHGRELWRSDGTASGTMLLRDIVPGRTGSRPVFLGQSAGLLFFSADDGEHGREPWRTDGTEAGTRLVADITADGSTEIVGMFPAARAVVFATDPGDGPPGLWATDGTPEGTRRLPAAPSSDGYPVAVVDGVVYFWGRPTPTESHGYTPGTNGDTQLWRTDGSEAGTWPVTGGTQSEYSQFVQLGGRLVFTTGTTAADGGSG